jgi:hypothetical protein
MMIDVSHDLPLVDGTETITLHSKLLQDSVIVAGVPREAVLENQTPPLNDGLQLMPTDTAFSVPAANLQDVVPAIADTLIDSDLVEWIVIGVRLTSLTRTYRLLCRKQR